MIQPAPPPERTRRLLLLAMGGLGAAAVMTQLALLRELVGAFSGNELVFGIGLGSWLLLTGDGTWLGRRTARLKDPAPVLIAGLMLVALLPLVQVVAVRLLRDVVFIRGATVDVTGITLGCLGLLAPFCLVSGALLTLTGGPTASAASAAACSSVSCWCRGSTTSHCSVCRQR